MTARPPKLDAEALQQALGGRASDAMSREGRVRMLGEAFSALFNGMLPSTEAALYLGGAGLSWLEQDGNLERDFLKVVKAKSHMTPARLWEQEQRAQSGPPHQDERQVHDEE